MPRLTVEITHYTATYRHVTIECDDPADAPRLAVDAICAHTMGTSTNGATVGPEQVDDEYMTPEFCTGIWDGEEAYLGTPHDVPEEWGRDFRIVNE